MVDSRPDLRPVASPVDIEHSDSQLDVIRRLNVALAQVSSVDETAALLAQVAAESLGYDDLVVYLREGTGHLVQRAAFGAKTDGGTAVSDPLLLPFGVGIVGAAAAEQRTVRVIDTHADDRYIVDDSNRRSELAVPVVVEGRTIAVLDSEHDDVGFYTEVDARHLEDIADIAAARLHAAMITEQLSRSVDELTVARQELEELSNSDPLTGLANRRRFDTELDRAVGRGAPLAVLTLDVDQFRSVNDLLGHTVGDAVLQQVALVLSACARPVSDACVARVGGDEFCVLVPGASEVRAASLARSIATAVRSASFPAVAESPLQIRVHIGAAIGTDRTVWAAASEALRIASEDEQAIFFHHDEDPRVHTRRSDLEWSGRIDRALEVDGFELFAQPIVHTDAPQASPPMYEALLRLRGDDGLITPDAFLPSARRTGALGRIDGWVIERAVAELSRAGTDASLTINTTPESFMSGAVHRSLVDSLAAGRVDPGRVVVELTEHSVVEDAGRFRARAADVIATGARIAIDDLGAGFSSIELLADSGVSIVKIAGEWVNRCVEDPVAATVVRAIARCAELLGVQVVAEGVEDEPVLDFVRTAGIGFTQGWLTGRPGPIREALRGGEVIPLPLVA